MKTSFLYFLLFCAVCMHAQTKHVGPKTRDLSVSTDTTVRLRGLADTIGYATRSEQMDLLMQRIDKEQGARLERDRKKADISPGDAWRLAIVPHDDYGFASFMYPLVLKNVQAKTVIIFGVAHKAKKFNLENKLVFDSYTHWKGLYGNIKVSGLREDILKELPTDMFTVNDSVQSSEHSVEAELPFLQYFDRDIQIISILVPPMSYDRMNEVSEALGKVLAKTLKKRDLEWGIEVSLLISTDAVHYGDEDWGGQDYSYYGCDSTGYNQAVAKELNIEQNFLGGDLLKDKIRKFNLATVQENDFHTYKWTWCGRYSVPFGMLCALALQQGQGAVTLNGMALDYCTSVDHTPLLVEDMGMGFTAKASLHHWVGYPAVVFR
ncbi:MAG TPA: AmmeMemoRadiSam system protein B [Bacteroidia bacterium]|nr:AmmeMemoRadiSam system protein B [Bacteroidia bacterium]